MDSGSEMAYMGVGIKLKQEENSLIEGEDFEIVGQAMINSDEFPVVSQLSDMHTLKRNGRRVSRQFWQAGDLFPQENEKINYDKTGIDRARLHPRFLHSNATSHKWALGALVELLDNSMDEVESGCTYVKVNKVNHPLDGAKNPMLLVEDDGGGMDTSTIRNCMSFGFSMKQGIFNIYKLELPYIQIILVSGKEMIGQYGNGFKTSTMRLGADSMVITKSRNSGTCSIGLLSYTFLSETNSQDVIVPIIDYNLKTKSRIARGGDEDWMSKYFIIQEWSPFKTEDEIWDQLNEMPSQGTRVYIWNLWQTSDDKLELDFNTDKTDILLHGSDEEIQEEASRKKRLDEGIKRCYAYRHSLRSYVSILYLNWPQDFKIIIRDYEVMQIPVSAGMKHVMVYEYKPRIILKEENITTTTGTHEIAKGNSKVVVVVNIGFAVEAPETSVSGFCVYHRNRLIKPFWKVYSSASSIGRGVIGYLLVDFVEPAHDKQVAHLHFIEFHNLV